MDISICITSDVHGRLDRYEHITQQMRALSPDLIIDNGDFLQGSLASYYYEAHHLPHPQLALANDIGVDVAIWGNHEFNYPQAARDAMQATCQFPWIACNIGATAQPYMIKKIGDVQLAIIGAVTAATPKWDECETTAGLSFERAAPAIERTIENIRAAHQVDAIIVSYHGGYLTCPVTGQPFSQAELENEANAIMAIDGIDLLITGHQHLIINGAACTPPTVQPGANGSGFMHVTLSLPTKAVQATFIPCTLEQQLPSDVSRWLDEPIAYTEEDFTFHDLLRSRLQSHPFEQLLHTMQLHMSQAQLSILDLGYVQTGGFTGTITRRHVLKSFGRPNYLTTVSLTGAELRAFLEQCAATFAISDGAIDFSYHVYPDVNTPYLYYFVGGVDYTFTIANPIGHRVTKLLYQQQPVQPTDTFEVALNSYLATGADFPILKKQAHHTQTSDTLTQLLLRFLQEKQTIQKANISHFTVKID